MLGCGFVSQGPKVSAKNVAIFGGHKLLQQDVLLRSLVSQRMFQKDGMQGGCFLKDSFPCQLKNLKLVCVL